MENVHSSSMFFSMCGFQADTSLLERIGRVRHSVVLTEQETGVLRAIHLDLYKPDISKNDLVFAGHYLLHEGPRKNNQSQFLKVHFKDSNGLMMIDEAFFLGYPLHFLGKGSNFDLMSGIDSLMDRVARRREWCNFIRIFEESGITLPSVGRKALPGLYVNGDVKRFEAQKHKTINIESSQEPVYPALFFHAIVGCGPEYYGDQTRVSHSLSIRDSDNGILYEWSYAYEKGEDQKSVVMICNLNVHTKESTSIHPLYRLEATPQKKDQSNIAIRSLELYHPNAIDGNLEKINLQDDQKVSDALKMIRMYNRAIRAGTQGLEEDLKRPPEGRRYYLPSDTLLFSGVTRTMMPLMPNYKTSRLVFTPLGGQNIRKIFSTYDTHIGANSYRLDYYSHGTQRPSSVIIDAGALFHDKYDLTVSNVGKYLWHSRDKSHIPEVDTKLLIFTHAHKDHLAQLAYLVKKGYVIPPIIMPPLVLQQIKRELHELKVDKDIQNSVLEKCIVIDSFSIPVHATKKNPKKIKSSQHHISIYWEYIRGDRLGSYERYPVLELNDFKIRMGPMPHSNPGFMYEIVTDGGAHLHTGDFKLDNTIEFYQTPYRPWLDNVTAKSVSVDSTGSTRLEGSRTPSELSIQMSLVRLFMEHTDKRFICSVLGSNVSRFTTLIAAMGAVKKEFLLVDGKALEDLFDDLNKSYDLHEWAQRVYGVSVVKQGSAEANRVYQEEPAWNYVVTATGTQDEVYSTMNRAIREWLPNHRLQLSKNDIIVPLQRPIPVGNNQKLRKSAKYFSEVFHEIPYILPEEIEKEGDYYLSGSGHASPQDIKDFYAMVPSCRVSFPIHGGPAQLEAGAKIAEESGLTSFILGNFEGAYVSKQNMPIRFRNEIGEVVGIKHQLPSEEQFYLKRNFRTTVVPIKPVDDSIAGKAIKGFENCVIQQLCGDEYSETAQIMGFSLSRAFNISSAKGYLVGNYAFGIERHKTSIYKAKRIGGYVAFDTEGTGTDPNLDHMEQFSYAFWDLDRNLVKEEEIVQKVPEYVTFHPEALLVTNRNPLENITGLHPVLFSERIQKSIKSSQLLSKDSFKKSYPEDFNKDSKARVKTLFIAHNLKFDDGFLRRLHMQTFSNKPRSHASDGSIGIDTRHIARILHAVYPNKFKVRKRENGFLDFTLKALCQENGLEYDEDKAHSSALYDSQCAMNLFWKMEEISPKIAAQMIINADSSTGHLLNDMTGMDTGFHGPYPVFSYLSPKASRADLRLGSLIGTVGGGRYAIVLNMTKSVKDIISLSPQKLLHKLKDREQDNIEIIDLRSNPMIFPASYFYRGATSSQHPKETIDHKAQLLRDHLNYVSPDTNWKNIAERLDALWNKDTSDFLKIASVEEEPALKYPASDILHQKEKSLNQWAAKSYGSSARSTFNPIKRKLNRKIQSYRKSAIAYLEGVDGIEVSEIYAGIIKNTRLTEDQKMLINNIHFDIKPDDMSEIDRIGVLELRAFYGAQTTKRASEALVVLDENPEKLNSFVMNDPQKQNLLDNIRRYVATRQERYRFDDGARSFVHKWRRDLQAA